jgi:hypothetical protein
MRCLALVAIIIFGLAQQAAKAPAPDSAPAQTNTGVEHPEDAQHTVGISKLPPVSVTRDWADWGVWVFSFLLVVVGFLQVWLLWRTLGAMKQQADLMKQQADIQEAAMQQWVEVVTTDAGGVDNQKSLRNNLLEVNLGFKVVNNTSVMLTIKRIVTKVGFFAERWETFTITTSVSLPPSKGKESAYPFYVPLRLNTEHVELFKKGTVLTIQGEVGFEDCLRKNQVDEFGGLYKFSPNVFEYMQPMGLVPEHKTENADY